MPTGRETDTHTHTLTEKPTELMRPVAAIEIGYAGHGGQLLTGSGLGCARVRTRLLFRICLQRICMHFSSLFKKARIMNEL